MLKSDSGGFLRHQTTRQVKWRLQKHSLSCSRVICFQFCCSRESFFFFLFIFPPCCFLLCQGIGWRRWKWTRLWDRPQKATQAFWASTSLGTDLCASNYQRVGVLSKSWACGSFCSSVSIVVYVLNGMQMWFTVRGRRQLARTGLHQAMQIGAGQDCTWAACPCGGGGNDPLWLGVRLGRKQHVKVCSAQGRGLPSLWSGSAELTPSLKHAEGAVKQHSRAVEERASMIAVFPHRHHSRQPHGCYIPISASWCHVAEDFLIKWPWCRSSSVQAEHPLRSRFQWHQCASSDFPHIFLMWTQIIEA